MRFISTVLLGLLMLGPAITMVSAETIEQQITQLDAAEAGQAKPQGQVLSWGRRLFTDGM